MEECLGDMHDEFCIPYLDHIVIFSRSFSDHVRVVLRRLREKGIKLKARQCRLFQIEIKYLGRLVSRDGYRIDPEAVKPIQSLKHTRPKMISEVRKLLGLLGYYRRYIRDFSRISKPLFDLLQNKELKNDVTTKAK